MKTARCQMGVAVLDRYLYVVGGSSISQDILSSVERYSFDEDKWSMVCALNVPRAIPAVAAADGLLCGWRRSGNLEYTIIILNRLLMIVITHSPVR